MKVIGIVVICLICAAFRAFGAEPVAVTRYHDRDLIPIKTKLRFTTLLVLPPGEEIEEVSCGDKQFWIIEGKDNILHIKPAKEAAVTNVDVVLKSKAVYSFVVEEIGSKGEPDLKVVLGEDEVLKVRSENKALEAAILMLVAEQKAALARTERKRAEEELAHRLALAQLEADIPARLTEFLTKQKFNYSCFVKTETCLGAVFETDTNTYVIGELGTTPVFSGTDDQGHFEHDIPFKRAGNVYQISKRIGFGTIRYHEKLLSFRVK